MGLSTLISECNKIQIKKEENGLLDGILVKGRCCHLNIDFVQMVINYQFYC